MGVLAVTFGAQIFAAPVPKEPSVFFPTKPGAKWVYKSGAEERTDVVTHVERKEKGGWIVSVGRLGPQDKIALDRVRKWDISDKHLVMVKSAAKGEGIVDWCYLRLPHEPGAKWPFEADQTVPHNLVAIKRQKVKVLAGEFEAVGVEDYLDGKLLMTRWYAVGVGLVKEVTSGGDTLSELKSFTPGKD